MLAATGVLLNVAPVTVVYYRVVYFFFFFSECWHLWALSAFPPLPYSKKLVGDELLCILCS